MASLREQLPETIDAPTLRHTLTDRLAPGTRATLKRALPVVLVGFVVVGLLGGWVVYAEATAPTTESEVTTVGTWTPEADFEHGATVVVDTPVFTIGERLEEQPLYLTEVTPELNGTYVLTHQGDPERATGSVELRLVIEAVDDPDAAEPVVYWRETEVLESTTVEELAPGGAHQVDFVVNATSLSDRITTIESELGASPGTTQAYVVSDTVLEAELDGDQFVDRRSDRLIVDPGGSTYSVTTELTETEPYEATATVETPIEGSPLRLYGGAVALLVGFLGAGGAAVVMRADLIVLTEAEETELAVTQAREEYDKWISRGSAPMADDRTVVELASLEDLVDVAIDSNRRVIDRGDATPRYVVLDDNVRYVFDPTEASA